MTAVILLWFQSLPSKAQKQLDNVVGLIKMDWADHGTSQLQQSTAAGSNYPTTAGHFATHTCTCKSIQG